MKKVILILSALVLMDSTAAQSRVHLPDESAVIDSAARAQCLMTVDGINAMPLKCDTLRYSPAEHGAAYRFKGICFDGQERLRKYVYQMRTDFFTHKFAVFSAYYGEDGELAFLHVHAGDDCEYTKESYYVHGGKIVDFALEYESGCFEFSDEEYGAYINEIRPVAGSALIKTVNNLPLENFIKAATLLVALKNTKRDEETDFTLP